MKFKSLSSDLISGMKIDRTQSQQHPKVSRANIVRRMLSDVKKEDKWKTMGDVDLDGRTPYVYVSFYHIV